MRRLAGIIDKTRVIGRTVRVKSRKQISPYGRRIEADEIDQVFMMSVVDGSFRLVLVASARGLAVQTANAL